MPKEIKPEAPKLVSVTLFGKRVNTILYGNVTKLGFSSSSAG